MNILNDLSWVESIRTPLLTPFFELITLMGYPIFLIMFISFGYYYWSAARFTRVAMLLFVSGIINSFLKDYFQDPRPAIEFMLDPQVGSSYGLPSGHAQIAVTLWGLLAYELKNQWITIGAVILIFLICFSRLYLGVHDLEDIALGLTVGLLILGIWHFSIKYNFFNNLNKSLIVVLILLFQLIAFNFYPTHQGHELSIWSLGAMMGWFLGFSLLSLKGNSVANFILSLISIGMVFIAMLATTSLAKSFDSQGFFDFIVVYILGLIFSLFITYFIPKTLKFFNFSHL